MIYKATALFALILIFAVTAASGQASRGVEQLHRQQGRGEKSLLATPWKMADEAEGVFKLTQEGSTLSVEFLSELEIERLMIADVEVEVDSEGCWVAELKKPKKSPKVTAIIGDNKLSLDLDQPVFRNGVAVLVVAAKDGKLKTSPSFWASKLPAEMR